MLFTSALAGLFLAASCQQENLEPVMSGNTVTYTVKVADAVATKAIGDNVNDVTELHYEVYRTNGEDVTNFTEGVDNFLYHGTETLSEGTATVNLELINGQNFTVLFWAQVPDNGVYDATKLTDVKVLQNATANQEKYAAFSNVDCITWGENLVGREIELKRAVAQLNIATTPQSLQGTMYDFEDDITLTNSNVTVTGLSTSFNVAKQEAGEISRDPFVFADHAVPTTTLQVGDNTYQYVAMNYVGFAKKEGSTVTVAYEFTTSEGKIDNEIENVPVKANYRTNIIGNLVTSKSDYIVELDTDWEDNNDPNYTVNVVSVRSAYDLQEAINEADDNNTTNIKLEGNITLEDLASLMSTRAQTSPYGLIIPAEKDIVLDLNGLDLSQTVACTAHYAMIKNLGSLTIVNSKETGAISFTDNGNGDSSFGWGSYTIENAGRLVIESGKVENATAMNTPAVTHMYSAIQQNNDNAVTIVNGGVVSSKDYRSIRINRGALVVNGGVCEGQIWMQPFADGSSVTITGGDFSPRGNDGSSVFVTNNSIEVGFSISGGYFHTKLGASTPVKGVTGGTFVVDPTNFVADGYDVVKNPDGTFKVWEAHYVKTEVNGVVTYQIPSAEALAQIAELTVGGCDFAGMSVVLTADIDLTGFTTNGDSFGPIGRYCSGQGVNKPFKGHFDGQNYTIKGIYQSGWDFGYEWGTTGYLGLFGYVIDATVENLTIEAMESVVEGGTLGAVAGRADGECVFKNITVKNCKLGTYNNRCGGIVGWTGGYYKDEAQTEVACHFTFENVEICEDVVLGGLWGSFDSSIGGVMGQLNSAGSALFKDVTVSCRIDAYNDCTASYDYYLYRMCGMLIGQMTKTTTIDGSTYPDVAAYGIEFDNVTVNYGKWMNYHYCEPTPGLNGGRGMRVEAGFTYDGLPEDYDHTQCVDNHYNCIPFDQLFGGVQTACKGVKAWEGVTVNYPAAYTCELCGETHNN